MDSAPSSLITGAIEILGPEDLSEDDVEQQVGALHPDPLMGRRLIDWTIEAFGMALIPRLGRGIQLPETFTARNARGEWETFPLTAEPVFAAALDVAHHIMREGPRSVFQRITGRSAALNTISNALNAGEKLDGAVLAGPAILGIPAESYSTKTRT